MAPVSIPGLVEAHPAASQATEHSLSMPILNLPCPLKSLKTPWISLDDLKSSWCWQKSDLIRSAWKQSSSIAASPLGLSENRVPQRIPWCIIIFWDETLLSCIDNWGWIPHSQTNPSKRNRGIMSHLLWPILLSRGYWDFFQVLPPMLAMKSLVDHCGKDVLLWVKLGVPAKWMVSTNNNKNIQNFEPYSILNHTHGFKHGCKHGCTQPVPGSLAHPVLPWHLHTGISCFALTRLEVHKKGGMAPIGPNGPQCSGRFAGCQFGMRT